MALKIFISATNTDIGKSYVSEILLREFSKLGYKVAYVKPIETGVKFGFENLSDGFKLHNFAKSLNSNLNNIDLKDVVIYSFELASAPAVARHGTAISFEKILIHINNLEKYSDLIIIEGAGGLMTPIDNKNLYIDLIKYLNYKTILISGSYLGSISDSLSAKFILDKNNINYIWAINIYKDIENFKNITEPFYIEYFGNYLSVQQNIEQILNMLKSHQ